MHVLQAGWCVCFWLRGIILQVKWAVKYYTSMFPTLLDYSALSEPDNCSESLSLHKPWRRYNILNLITLAETVPCTKVVFKLINPLPPYVTILFCILHDLSDMNKTHPRSICLYICCCSAFVPYFFSNYKMLLFNISLKSHP